MLPTTARARGVAVTRGASRRNRARSSPRCAADCLAANDVDPLQHPYVRYRLAASGLHGPPKFCRSVENACLSGRGDLESHSASADDSARLRGTSKASRSPAARFLARTAAGPPVTRHVDLHRTVVENVPIDTFELDSMVDGLRVRLCPCASVRCTACAGRLLVETARSRRRLAKRSLAPYDSLALESLTRSGRLLSLRRRDASPSTLDCAARRRRAPTDSCDAKADAGRGTGASSRRHRAAQSSSSYCARRRSPRAHVRAAARTCHSSRVLASIGTVLSTPMALVPYSSRRARVGSAPYLVPIRPPPVMTVQVSSSTFKY